MNVLCTFLQEEVGGIENFLFNLQFDDFDGMDGTDDDDDDDDDDLWICVPQQRECKIRLSPLQADYWM